MHPHGLLYLEPKHLRYGPVPSDCFGGFHGVLYKKHFFGDGTLLRWGLFTDYPEGLYVDDDYLCGIAGLLGSSIIILEIHAFWLYVVQ